MLLQSKMPFAPSELEFRLLAGVDPSFITTEDLLRVRNLGVSPAFDKQVAMLERFLITAQHLLDNPHASTVQAGFDFHVLQRGFQSFAHGRSVKMREVEQAMKVSLPVYQCLLKANFGG